MAFKANMLVDSIHPQDSSWRLTTMELTYPRFVHSEFMTHRMFSRNSASSRAIPVAKLLKQIEEDPVIPLTWGINCKGMQNKEVLTGEKKAEAEEQWLLSRDAAVCTARYLSKDSGLNVHKQLANRIVEPWMWITVIVTGNEIAWANFFKLRCHEAAEQHIAKIAYMAREIYDSPQVKERYQKQLQPGEWHLPFAKEYALGLSGDKAIKVSVARTCRGSYLNQHGEFDHSKDFDLHDQVRDNGHWSPFEHQAEPFCSHESLNRNGGNLGCRWTQYRKLFPGECAKV